MPENMRVDFLRHFRECHMGSLCMSIHKGPNRVIRDWAAYILPYL